MSRPQITPDIPDWREPLYEWAKELTKDIPGQRTRADACQEIAGHLLDKAEFLMSQGCPPQRAVEQALAEMGEPGPVRERLAQVHSFQPQLALNRAMSCLCWGFILSFVDVFSSPTGLAFDLLGLCLMAWAAWRLRGLNPAWRRAWYYGLVMLAANIVAAYLALAPAGWPEATPWVSWGAILPFLLFILAVGRGMQGLLTAYKPESQRAPATASKAMALWELVLFLIFRESSGLSTGLIGGILLLAVPILFLRSLIRSNWDLQEGEEVTLQPLKKAARRLTLLVIILCVSGGFILAGWELRQQPEASLHVLADVEDPALAADAAEIRRQLLDLGLPLEIIGDLPDSEILLFAGAEGVTWEEYLEPIEDQSKLEPGESPAMLKLMVAVAALPGDCYRVLWLGERYNNARRSYTDVVRLDRGAIWEESWWRNDDSMRPLGQPTLYLLWDDYHSEGSRVMRDEPADLVWSDVRVRAADGQERVVATLLRFEYRLQGSVTASRQRFYFAETYYIHPQQPWWDRQLGYAHRERLFYYPYRPGSGQVERIWDHPAHKNYTYTFFYSDVELVPERMRGEE